MSAPASVLDCSFLHHHGVGSSSSLSFPTSSSSSSIASSSDCGRSPSSAATFLIHAPIAPLNSVSAVRNVYTCIRTRSPHGAGTWHASCPCSKTGWRMTASRWLQRGLESQSRGASHDTHTPDEATPKVYPIQAMLFRVHVPK